MPPNRGKRGDGDERDCRSRPMTGAEKDPTPQVAVTPLACSCLAAATAALGGLNTVMASFLLEDPFRTGIDDLRAELQGVRDAGVDAMDTVQVACPTIENLDLEPVADAALDTVWGVISLLFRSLDVLRRTGLRPMARARVDRLEKDLRDLVDFLPVAMPSAWVRGAKRPPARPP